MKIISRVVWCRASNDCSTTIWCDTVFDEINYLRYSWVFVRDKIIFVVICGKLLLSIFDQLENKLVLFGKFPCGTLT